MNAFIPKLFFLREAEIYRAAGENRAKVEQRPFFRCLEQAAVANRVGALKPGSSFLSRPHLLACGPGIGFVRDLLAFTKGLESVKNIASYHFPHQCFYRPNTCKR